MLIKGENDRKNQIYTPLENKRYQNDPRYLKKAINNGLLTFLNSWLNELSFEIIISN